MKILFLNPHVDAEHPVVKALQARGLAVLLPNSPEEAWQMLQLHGTSMDLAIVHRENSGKDLGLKFIAKVKADAAQADLPFVLTSEEWSDVQFAKHQNSPEGANAYLRWPHSEGDLIATIDAVFGKSPAAAAAEIPGAAPETVITFSNSSEIPSLSLVLEQPEARSEIPTLSAALLTDVPMLELEERSEVFKQSDQSNSSIVLEAPDFHPSSHDLPDLSPPPTPPADTSSEELDLQSLNLDEPPTMISASSEVFSHEISSVDISGIEAQLSSVDNLFLMYTFSGWEPPRGLYPPYTYPTADGSILLGAVGPRFLDGMARAAGQPTISSDPRFNSPMALAEHLAEFDELMLPFFLGHGTVELVALLQNHGVLCAPLQSAQTALHDPQYTHRSFFRPLDTDVSARVPGPIFRLDAGVAPPVPDPAPSQGQHTAEVLADWLALDAEKIRRLLELGAVV